MDRNVTNSVIVTRSKTGSITNNVNIGRHVADEDWAELVSLAKPHGKHVIKQLLEVQNLVNANKGEQARSTWEKIRGLFTLSNAANIAQIVGTINQLTGSN
ncbi:hypothetical protein [Terriglobus sp.]|uniref:hypothetical protein n=1 Tax=Terriglobus sp. TaxID=1889013 RepID=UPI003B00C5EE